MTTLREAAQQALEALEMYAIETDSEFQRKAITALLAALAQQAEPVEPAPQRKPLTEVEIDQITRDRWGTQLLGVMVQAHREYARAVERAHGIKERT